MANMLTCLPFENGGSATWADFKPQSPRQSSSNRRFVNVAGSRDGFDLVSTELDDFFSAQEDGAPGNSSDLDLSVLPSPAIHTRRLFDDGNNLSPNISVRGILGGLDNSPHLSTISRGEEMLSRAMPSPDTKSDLISQIAERIVRRAAANSARDVETNPRAMNYFPASSPSNSPRSSGLSRSYRSMEQHQYNSAFERSPHLHNQHLRSARLSSRVPLDLSPNLTLDLPQYDAWMARNSRPDEQPEQATPQEPSEDLEYDTPTTTRRSHLRENRSARRSSAAWNADATTTRSSRSGNREEKERFNISLKALSDKPSDLYNTKYDDIISIGKYTKAVRRRKIRRYKQKMREPNLERKVVYRCRKKFAKNRPRIGGRFTKLKS